MKVFLLLFLQKKKSFFLRAVMGWAIRLAWPTLFLFPLAAWLLSFWLGLA